MTNKSIVRKAKKEDKKITVAGLYDNIQAGKNRPEFHRQTLLLLEDKEYLIMETLGKGRMGFVFLAYCQRKLTALKLSYHGQKGQDLFSSVKKTFDDYRHYFLQPQSEPLAIGSFYLGDTNPDNNIPFDRTIHVTAWEPADAVASDKLDETFEIKFQWFRQFLTGLAMIHSKDRAHFDVKPGNLFLVGNRLKIGDFEFYSKIDDFIRSDISFCGTIGHIAPEIFYDRENITPKIDIFSAGIAFARLFLAKEDTGGAEGSHWALDMSQLPLGERLFKDKDFRLNYKIYFFYKTQLEERLHSTGLSNLEKETYQMLLRMIDIDPSRRPTAVELLQKKHDQAAPASPSLIFKEPRVPVKESSKTVKTDTFSQMLQNHDKRNVIKYCLVPDLIEKLKYDKIKKMIKVIKFEGDDYDLRYFSFQGLDMETELIIQLFGKNVSSSKIKDYQEWNELVIAHYWNRSFNLGLKNGIGKKEIKKLLDAGELDGHERDLFRSQIKATQKKLSKLREKIME